MIWILDQINTYPTMTQTETQMNVPTINATNTDSKRKRQTSTKPVPQAKKVKTVTTPIGKKSKSAVKVKTSPKSKAKAALAKTSKITKAAKAVNKNAKSNAKKPSKVVVVAKPKKLTPEQKEKAKLKAKAQKEKEKKKKDRKAAKDKQLALKAEKKPKDFRKFVIIDVASETDQPLSILVDDKWKNTKLKSTTPANAAKKAGNELVRSHFPEQVGGMNITVEERKRRGLRQVSRAQFKYHFVRFEKTEADYKEVNFTKKKKTDAIAAHPPKNVAFKFDCRIKAIRQVKEKVTKRAKVTTIVEPEAPETQMVE